MTTQKSPNNKPPVILEKEPLPQHVIGWCWGGFFLGWIWGLGNRTYWALLCLIPGVNIIMHFVLGIKGREWAWKNNSWKSIASFKRTQRIWSIAGLITCIVIAVFLAPFVITIVVFSLASYATSH